MSSAPTISLSKKFQGSSPIDGKTPISFLVGFVAGMAGLNASWAAVTVIGFEAFLIMLEEGSVGAAFEKRSPQSYGNQAVDTMVGILGVYYGDRMRTQQQMAAVATSSGPTIVKSQPQEPDMTKLIAASNTDVAPITEVSGVPWYR